MRLIGLLLFIVLSGCLNASEIIKPVECDFEFASAVPCSYNSIKAKLNVKHTDEDEVLLTSITVTQNNIVQKLKFSDDFTFLKGETGYILFSDINFDGKTDIAITTSFGTPNLYLSYWIFNSDSKRYKFIGNFSKFSIDDKLKTLSNSEKINAAKYRNNHYFWKNNALIKK